MPPISLHQYVNGRLVDVRATVTGLREQVEAALLRGEECVLDFAGVQATQSFVDELVGLLILHHGPDILARIVFRSCSDDMRAIIEFVAADRCDQYLKTRSH